MEIIQIGKSNKLIYNSAMHKHRHTEIIYNLSGSGTMKFSNGETYPFNEGTVTVIPPEIGHEKYSEQGFHDIWIKINGRIFKDEYPIIINHIESEKLKVIMEMCLEWYAQNDSSLHLSLNCATDLINELLHYMRSSKYDTDIEKLLHKIAQNFTNPEFDLSAVIKNSGYCTDHFRRKFKKQIGYTPLEYLNKTRLEYAKRLLERSDNAYSVGEIAYFSGFYDQHYFSRLFKKQFGCSPKEKLNRI